MPEIERLLYVWSLCVQLILAWMAWNIHNSYMLSSLSHFVLYLLVGLVEQQHAAALVCWVACPFLSPGVDDRLGGTPVFFFLFLVFFFFFPALGGMICNELGILGFRLVKLLLFSMVTIFPLLCFSKREHSAPSTFSSSIGGVEDQQKQGWHQVSLYQPFSSELNQASDLTYVEDIMLVQCLALHHFAIFWKPLGWFEMPYINLDIFHLQYLKHLYIWHCGLAL